MKVIICGTREVAPHRAHIEAAVHLSGFTITEVVSGGATGVDSEALRWAEMMGIDRVTFHYNGKRAKAGGPLRNERMAKYAEACIALPGGRGTADMVTRAKAHGLRLYEVKP